MCRMMLPFLVTVGLGLLSSGYCDAVIAGGVDTMSDVPIRHSKRMRRLMLAMARTKTLQQRMPLIAQMLNPKNWQPEVCPVICFILDLSGFMCLVSTLRRFNSVALTFLPHDARSASVVLLS